MSIRVVPQKLFEKLLSLLITIVVSRDRGFSFFALGHEGQKPMSLKNHAYKQIIWKGASRYDYSQL